MIVGIVLSAVALEEAFLHPHEPLETIARAVFVIGIACFLLGVAAATYRATGVALRGLILGVPVVAAIVFGARSLAGPTTVIVVTIVLLASMVVEYVRHPHRADVDHDSAAT